MLAKNRTCASVYWIEVAAGSGGHDERSRLSPRAGCHLLASEDGLATLLPSFDGLGCSLCGGLEMQQLMLTKGLASRNGQKRE